MKAVLFHDFGGPLTVEEVPDPTPADDGAVIRVRATGVCRSDWHGWRGHDPDIDVLPHVPGHELAGQIVALGRDVSGWEVGQRVTMPFVAGCGACRECQRGDQQVCPQQFQPGFTAWGSFAEYVAVRYAATNLIHLPEDVEFTTAAAFGCRLSTAYRAVRLQGRVGQKGAAPGQWVAVHGCGGVGLSAIMVASALGARVIGVDIRPEPLQAAREAGAAEVIDASQVSDPAEAIRELTDGGAELSLDAIGSPATAANSVRCLRRRGRHVQVGLLAGADAGAPLPLDRVIAWELEIVGSHGLQAHEYGGLLELCRSGRLDPTRLVHRTLPLAEAPAALAAMDEFTGSGIAVVTID